MQLSSTVSTKQLNYHSQYTEYESASDISVMQ